MPVSALPSKTGVGELGPYAREFIGCLADSGVGIWQILPLNPVGYGNSPYQPYSSFAGDELYISLEELYQDGLLEELAPVFTEDNTRVDYEAVRSWKLPYLRKAFEKFLEKEMVSGEDYQKFISREWVHDYGVFRALKNKNQGKCWNEWRKEEKNWCENRKALPEDIEKEAEFHMFLQYIFYIQWMKLKTEANQRGIQIMGDVPFYVGIDSVDVWSGKDNFLLDTDGRPIFIAGVPPDYFSATGQRWGNPIYDWDYMKKTDYEFWVKRIGSSGELFDIVRIDHFRAFDTFWKIPASCPTAIDGEWIEAPGYEVIDILLEKLPGIHLVAEDLGLLRPEVLKLKDHYGFKGMKILQFSIDTSGKYAKDTFHDSENMIMYTGTHDNDTLVEWYGKLSKSARRKVRRFLKKEHICGGKVRDRLLRYAWESPAEYVIIPLSDLLGLGKEGHINTPGTVGSPNWEWHMPSMEKIQQALKQYEKFLKKQ